MTRLLPGGTARAAWTRLATSDDVATTSQPEDFEPAYWGWEIARCAPALDERERRIVAALSAACILSMRAGSTRLPLSGEALAGALSAAGFEDVVREARQLLERARSAASDDPVTVTIGRSGDRKPLIIDGDWLYAERMHALELSFCARVRDRASRASLELGRRLDRVVSAVSVGPPALTDEQTRAIRKALTASLVLITGGPGTGKTATAVALLRALAWMGTPMDQIAVAAPTGKAAQRLTDSMNEGLSRSRDLADANLRTSVPEPLTLHRLLGWSPSRGKFARHENDPLPNRFVIVDEASMIDLAMMDRLLRALGTDARLVLIGDADQLPSIEAGAVFRDLCHGLGAVRLTSNLRVAHDVDARRITDAACAVNAGDADGLLRGPVTVRRAGCEVEFVGVEHLAAPWSDVAQTVADRWWRERVAASDGFAQRSARVYRVNDAFIDECDEADLRSLFQDHRRSRVLCVTRVRWFATSSEAINDRFISRLVDESADESADERRARYWRPERPLVPGTLVSMQRNDYERGLYNGDEGVVIRTLAPNASEPQLMIAFARRERFEAFPVDGMRHVAPSFAMTVHRSQGSEFDHVMFVLPEADIPLLSRELLYTAVTRARRSVLIVGSLDLLARTVSRSQERSSGVAERLKTPA